MAKQDKYALDDKARSQIRKMFDVMGINAKPCRLCGRDVYFLKTASGKAAPYTDDAISHFADCPNAAEFRRR